MYSNMGTLLLRTGLVCRQPTRMDKLCYEATEESRAPIGSRLFCDCDRLMEELMTCLLSTEDLAEWENEREARMKLCAQQRDPPSAD